MAGPYIFDRVKETSTTTGTGTLTLAGAVSKFRAFSDVLSNSDTVYYAIEHQSAAEYEWGIGTFTTSGTTLARTVVLGGSNGTSAVNLSAGTKHVFVSPLATMLGHRLPEIAVTGAVTATIDRIHYCTGTSADYTVTLPAAANNYGRRLWFRMGPLSALSKLVTLDGNSSETIDGATTRVMWAGESCELWCDGSNWFKVGGLTLPMLCNLAASSNQAVANNTETKITLGTSLLDNTGVMGDTATSRITCKRTGKYMLVPLVRFSVSGANASKINSWARANGSGYKALGEASGLNSAAVMVGIPAPVSLTLADYLELWNYHNQGSSQDTVGTGGQDGCNLNVVEIPTW